MSSLTIKTTYIISLAKSGNSSATLVSNPSNSLFFFKNKSPSSTNLFVSFVVNALDVDYANDSINLRNICLSFLTA